jgi:predicted  nucleic acid-binding Zn-ribbon protein
MTFDIDGGDIISMILMIVIVMAAVAITRHEWRMLSREQPADAVTRLKKELDDLEENYDELQIKIHQAEDEVLGLYETLTAMKQKAERLRGILKDK